MPKIDLEVAKRLNSLLSKMHERRDPFFRHWQDLADYILPRRYIWLLSSDQDRAVKEPSRNTKILDSTGTNALKVLQSGMMNGITSPTRPWLRLRGEGLDENDKDSREWYDEVARRMHSVFAMSNFYNGIGTVYGDISNFATAAMLIYEDEEKVIHCYNSPLGEFYLGQDAQGRVNQYARWFKYTVQQCVDEFGYENCSENVKQQYARKDGSRLNLVVIGHLIHPNYDGGPVPKSFEYCEYYWEKAEVMKTGMILRARGFHEMPGIFPRWDVTGNEEYGSSCPGMDALPDIIQLQHETLRKAQALDKMVSPPMLADVMLSNRPTSILPNGVTYVPGLNNGGVGMKPAYQVTPPLQELTQDIREIQARIRETFHNDLFRMISELDTVRSASEIDARREEKLILLGPVLDRFGYEALDRAVQRVFNIMLRGGLLPPPPDAVKQSRIEIQYVSILSSAQSAVATAPVERFLALTGNLAAAYPQVLDIPNIDELVTGYARDLGVPAKGINSPDQIAQVRQERNAPAATEQALAAGESLSKSAQLLSQTPVGAGGDTALNTLLGGGA